MSVTLEADPSRYPLETWQLAWFKGNFYFPPVQGATLSSAFVSGGMPFRGVVNMDDVNGMIHAAQAVLGVSVVVRSTSTPRATNTPRSGEVVVIDPLRSGTGANPQV